MDKILTPKEVCVYLKIHQRTLYRMIDEGKLHFAFKIAGSWRFLEKDVELYVYRLRTNEKSLTYCRHCDEHSCKPIGSWMCTLCGEVI